MSVLFDVSFSSVERCRTLSLRVVPVTASEAVLHTTPRQTGTSPTDSSSVSENKSKAKSNTGNGNGGFELANMIGIIIAIVSVAAAVIRIYFKYKHSRCILGQK